eukprot:COSAG03_NODE_15647_length_424_cov_0.956923_1_plen_62_part_10
MRMRMQLGAPAAGAMHRTDALARRLRSLRPRWFDSRSDDSQTWGAAPAGAWERTAVGREPKG